MKITVLPNSGDQRGFSAACRRGEFRLPTPLQELHCTTVLPGMVRGNHYHRVRAEFIVAFFADQCRVAWDEGEGTPVQVRDFTGGGALAIEVEALHSHAIKNMGTGVMVLMALSDFEYSPENPDSFPRVVL